MAESLKKKTVKGVAWTSLNQFLNMGLGFVIGVILARLLSPSDYGLLAMIGVFNAIAFSFLDSGFGNALVRKPNLTEDDTTTAFYFNLMAGVILFGILWMIAPWVAVFYDKPILTPLVRAEGSLLIVSSFKIVQQTQLTRALNFRAKMIIRVVASICGGITGIVAAYSGLGVWALVAMHIADALISLVLLWIISPWRPRGKWSKTSFRYLWGYGSKLLASGLLDTIYVIQQVTFPVLSQIQEDNSRLGNNYRRMLRFTVFIVFPVMMGMAALAYPLVISLVTDKWAQCVPYLQVICFASMWYPVHAINLNLLQVKGRSDLFLRLEIIKKALVTVVIFVCVPFGIMGICCGAVFTSLACLAINTYYTGKLINVAAFYLAIAKIFRMPELQEALDIIHRR